MRSLLKARSLPIITPIRHAKRCFVHESGTFTIDKKLQMVAELSEKYGFTLPDNIISELESPEKIVALFESRKVVNASFKGIPALELLRGQETPPNLHLHSYRKKKWSNQVCSQFVAKAYSNIDNTSDK